MGGMVGHAVVHEGEEELGRAFGLGREVDNAKRQLDGVVAGNHVLAVLALDVGHSADVEDERSHRLDAEFHGVVRDLDEALEVYHHHLLLDVEGALGKIRDHALLGRRAGAPTRHDCLLTSTVLVSCLSCE